jgi:hypothetical protein
MPHLPRPHQPRRGASIAERQRALKALELYTNGLTFAEIAAKLDYADPSGPRKAIIGLNEAKRSEGVTIYREIIHTRMQRLVKANMPKAKKGDFKAARVIVATADRDAKLEGLYTERVITGTDDEPEDLSFLTRAQMDVLGALLSTAKTKETDPELRERLAKAIAELDAGVLSQNGEESNDEQQHPKEPAPG